MMPVTLPRAVVPDANILFSATLRDVFMWLHHEGLVQVRWTQKIEQEWQKNVIAKGFMTTAQAQHCELRMKLNCEDWEITGYGQYEALFPEVDRKDRHVVAAAHRWAAGDFSGDDPDAFEPAREVALVTLNVKDFNFQGVPTLARLYTPDDYLVHLFKDNPSGVAGALGRARRNLLKPPVTPAGYVQSLVDNQCKQLALMLAGWWGVQVADIKGI